MSIYREIVEALNKKVNINNFGLSSSDWDLGVDTAEDLVYYALDLIPNYIDVECGASKIVIIPVEGDYVLKIPFNGVWACDEEYDRELQEWRYNYDNPYFRDFCITDYCQLEVEKYHNLCAAGLETFVEEIKLYDYLDCGLPVYIQHKVREFYDKDAPKHPSDNSMAIAKKKLISINTTWVAFAIDWYTEEVFDKFLRYIHEEDDDIGRDLHSGNIGFRLNGEPVILDYAGFME